ncbi:LysR family transcriptional regulator [Psychrobacter sp. I-STPA10]|uniref:LysR family transcriptional regulator n=1 Tax=Psychrobacter sp. I-STPA10 TaxID=2585769 RepID=UPI001E38D969|nr:LysR family transcriptional regulator [Psychrobacter sp. I-STPA10]
MQLKQLHAFHAVAVSKSFSEAATTTKLSQPTLSRLIKQLEEDIGTQLLDRYHRPLQLTPAGVFFLQHTQSLLTELETVINITKRIATPQSTLNIGFVPSVLYGLLPDIISRLKLSMPDLEIQLKDINSYQQIAALKSGEIDVGFGRFAITSHTHTAPISINGSLSTKRLSKQTSDTAKKLVSSVVDGQQRPHKNLPTSTQVRQILLRHERYVVALPKLHPLANVPNQHLMNLADNHLILYHQTHLPISSPDAVREPLLHLFAQHGIQPYNTTTVSDLQVALGLVAAGEGITLVPDSLKTVRTQQITYQRLIHENATSPIYLNILQSIPHPAFAALLEAIYSIYEEKGITYRRFENASN